jgi:hypothetical protein
MRFLRLVLIGVALATGGTLKAQDFIDRLDEALSYSAFNANLRARVSGTLDLEYYHFEQPAPGLIDAGGHDLFNPRLTLFLDAQIGTQFYFFAQTRIDRHFDPSDRGAQIRLDEYALRFTPWEDSRLNIQVGKFATVFGRWVARHLSWENPFITAPLVYENTLPLEDYFGPEIPFPGRRKYDKREYIPVIWGPSYASGLSVAGRVGMFEYAAEIKNASLASRPESWDATRVGFDHPTVNARLGFRPNEEWNIGFSASDGAYFRPEAEMYFPSGRDIGDYHQTSIAQDITYEHHHWQLWAEFHETRFEIPLLEDGCTFGYFLELKYKFTPQLFGALRWNQQFFNDISDGAGGNVQFAPDISRIEIAGTYRFTAHTQLKLEYYLECEEDRDAASNFAAQFTVRF